MTGYLQRYKISMERNIYILGTDHKYQRNNAYGSSDSKVAFIRYLEDVCQVHGINAIGEEMSLDALKGFGLKNSIPELFAQEHGLKHKYCDPDHNEQKKLGIIECGHFTQTKKLPERLQPEEIKNITQEEAAELEWKEDLKREPFWLCEILELNVWPLLFICGSKHVESFCKLLATESFNAKIVNDCWEPRNK